MPNYFVIITTHQRSALLRLNLQSLLNQRYCQANLFNITVGILRNGVDSDSDIVIESFRKKSLQYPFIKAVIVHASNIKRPPPEARNYLWQQHQDYDYYVFIDDDAYFKKNYFSTLEKYLSHHKVDLIGGPNYSFLKKNPFQRLQNKFLASRWCGPFRHRYMGRNNSISKTKNSFILCNLVVSKNIFTPFASHIKFGEELFMLDNFFQNGIEAHYLKNLVVFHRRREKVDDFLIQILKYGVGRGEYLRVKETAARLILIISLLFFLTVLLIIEKSHIIFKKTYEPQYMKNFYFAIKVLRAYSKGVLTGLIFTR